MFNQFIFEYNTLADPSHEKTQSEVEKDLAKILKIRFKSDAPRRPPRVIVLGPPGSGRTTMANSLVQQFGLVRVCVRDLLKNEIRENPQNGATITKCIDSGEPVPDHIVNALVENRLK